MGSLLTKVISISWERHLHSSLLMQTCHSADKVLKERILTLLTS